MPSESKNIIAIVGSTGTQGSSVAKTFLSLKNWTVRCLTRSPNSSTAESLRAQGAEIVQAELDDVSSLSRAFQGATAIFVNTDFWAPYGQSLSQGKDRLESAKIGYDTELRHATNSIEAAAKVPTLKRFIYSALGPMKKASGGKYSHCYHWEGKAAIVDLIEANTDLAPKSSFIYIGAYSTNPFLVPQKIDGEWQLRLPGPGSTHLPVIDTARSTGKFVRALVEDEEPGLKLLAYDEEATAKDVLEAWNKVTGEKARFVQLSYEQMQKDTGLPPEILDGAAFLGEYKYMDGLEGKIVTPKDLHAKIEMLSVEEIFKARGVEELLASRFPVR